MVFVSPARHTTEVASLLFGEYPADALTRVQDHPTSAIDELLPGAWTAARDDE